MWYRPGSCEVDINGAAFPGEVASGGRRAQCQREPQFWRKPGAEVDVAAIRARFSSLRQGFAFFDAPGGTQVPDEVGEAIARALREASANLGAGYATSIRVGQILEEAEYKAARFLGCEPHEVIFGPNMTTLNFALSRTAARAFQPGDEILVSCLDHDAGVAPWLEIAHDRDLVVRHVALHDDTTLDFADLESKLGPRTRVVAFAWASNAVGTVTDARRVCQLAHDAGALAWVDAVHYAAHEPIDVRAIGADMLICSPYKFCGPHLGVAAGRSEVMRAVAAVQGTPGAHQPAGTQLRDRHAEPTNCWPGSTRPSTTSTRSGASPRSAPTSARSASGSSTACPTPSPSTDGRGWRAACRRSWSTSTAWTPRTWRHGWPTRRSGSGRTTRGTRSACTSSSATPASRSGSASSTTTRRRRSTGSTGALNGLRLSRASPAGRHATRLPRRGSRRACPG